MTLRRVTFSFRPPMVVLLLSMGIWPLATAGTWAAVSGACSSCHTMHNSQGGTATASGGPYGLLLVSSCVGCHTGTNTTSSVALTQDTDAPYVISSTAVYDSTGTGAGANTLAGGNFHWVASDETRGHNVQGVSAAIDSRYTTVPGSSRTYNSSIFLTCAGSLGCHGQRDISDPYAAMRGTHHATAANRTADAYRFLENVDSVTSPTTFTDIGGVEDGDWEFHADVNAHNQYQGAARTSDGSNDKSTISSFCASCHGDFHNNADGGGIAGSAWGSPWIRHPVDYTMPNSGEYASYNDTVSSGAYSVVVPVARATPGSGDATKVFNYANDSIVMCLSCHRAHGSPYSAAMRWDYKGWPANGITYGCSTCHTTKD